MFATLFRAMSTAFCSHEWARRSGKGRMYLECVHCLTTTPGIQVGHEHARGTQQPSATLNVATAA